MCRSASSAVSRKIGPRMVFVYELTIFNRYGIL
jgi:hypothetical protein